MFDTCIYIQIYIYSCIWPYILIYAPFWHPRGAQDLLTAHSHPRSWCALHKTNTAMVQHHPTSMQKNFYAPPNFMLKWPWLAFGHLIIAKKYCIHPAYINITFKNCKSRVFLAIISVFLHSMALLHTYHGWPKILYSAHTMVYTIGSNIDIIVCAFRCEDGATTCCSIIQYG